MTGGSGARRSSGGHSRGRRAAPARARAPERFERATQFAGAESGRSQRLSRSAAREAQRRRRQRQRRTIGAGIALAVLVGGGGYAAVAGSTGGDGGKAKNTARGGDGGGKDSPGLLADQKFLLDASAARPLASKGGWEIVGTSEGQDAPERIFTCQAQRFADPAGVRAWGRNLRNTTAKASAVQWVELSNDDANAGKAYDTITSWLSACNSSQQRLIASYKVTGLGDRALIAVFGQPIGGPNERYRAITVAGTGPATMLLEQVTTGTTPPAMTGLMAASTSAVQRICAETKTACAKVPSMRPSLLPASGEPAGFMSPVDLPVLSALKQPWVGVDAAAKGTGCEQIDPVKARAVRSKARVYVVPGANVPDVFGIDTMVAEFANAQQAHAYVTAVTASVNKCPTTHSNAKVRRTTAVDFSGIRGQTWRITYDVGAKLPDQVYRVGIARAGNRAAYVSFPVATGLDITDEAFTDAVIRAGERSLSFR